MNNALDVFNDDAFSIVSLTDSVNHAPFVPGRAGQVANWEETGIETTIAMIEERGGELMLLDPTPRGGPGQTSMELPDRARALVVPHYEHNDLIMADSVQNVRAFGGVSVLETLRDRVNRRLQQHVAWKLDPTLEFQRLGALKGVIVNANGSTLYNLYDEFDVTPHDAVNFDLANANPAAGILREKCDDVSRAVANALGNLPMPGLHAFCGVGFWKALIKHKEVREVYLASQTMAQALLNPMAYKTIKIGDITFEEYRGQRTVPGSPNPVPFIADDDAHIFPVGVPGLYRTIYAPADYEETVNTTGLPRYARQYPMANGKGRHLDTQMNALNYCVKPRCLIKGTRTG